jgi:ribosome recycling factor
VIEDIKTEAGERMEKSLDALAQNFNKIRTGRAHPSILDGLRVEYYGSETPLSQVANVNVEDARTLSLTVWDKSMIQDVERAIMKSDLGLNQTRKGFIRQARKEAESARVSVRNARRDAISMLKELVKDKEISEDDERRGQEAVQKLTDSFVARAEKMLADKESDLMEI